MHHDARGTRPVAELRNEGAGAVPEKGDAAEPDGLSLAAEWELLRSMADQLSELRRSFRGPGPSPDDALMADLASSLATLSRRADERLETDGQLRRLCIARGAFSPIREPPISRWRYFVSACLLWSKYTAAFRQRLKASEEAASSFGPNCWQCTETGIARCQYGVAGTKCCRYVCVRHLALSGNLTLCSPCYDRDRDGPDGRRVKGHGRRDPSARSRRSPCPDR